ncbi:MAG: L-fuculokinase [Arcticibacterium sp.]|jgi:L-fuculokinase
MTKACLVFNVLPNVLSYTVFDLDLNVLQYEERKKNYILDEEGNSAEDLLDITSWVKESVDLAKASKNFDLAAVNFNSYAGGLVHLDGNGKPLCPVIGTEKLLGYKNKTLIQEILDHNKGQRKAIQLAELSFETAALQLFYLKINKPKLFHRIKRSLSLAQYLQSVFTKKYFHDHTNIGSHSASWDFENHGYHAWLDEQNLEAIKQDIVSSSEVTSSGDRIAFGPGIYNKVAETIPFLAVIKEPFVLLSTGAWTACINPFNNALSSESDLKNNCFNILNEHGQIIKMARLFSGNEHSRQIRHLETHFDCASGNSLNISYNPDIIRKLRNSIPQVLPERTELGRGLDSPFMERNLNAFATIEEAYHQFIMDLVAQQVASIKLTIEHDDYIKKIFVEGGLAKNEIFMELLSEAFHNKGVYKVGFDNTAAMGAAMAIGDAWGAKSPTKELLKLELIS